MIIICGAGIIGLSIAKELVTQGFNGKEIIIFEKEKEVGAHASGRNSGVLHAGIYYTPDSLKAKFCLKGNFLMREYCKEKGLKLLECGKVIVCRKEKDLPILYELYRRASFNGAKVEILDEKELKEIEPYAKTIEKALWSPYTAVIDPLEILISLKKDLEKHKVKILTNTKVLNIKGFNQIVTNNGIFNFDLFINCAGSYADKIAHKFNVGLNYAIVPFKGLYKKLKKEKSYLVKGNIYPVPNIKNPFLGVHFTKSVNGDVYVGPTATPAFGRENYSLLKGIDKEIFQIMFTQSKLLIFNKDVRKAALSEIKKYLNKYFFNEIKNMVEGLKIYDLEKCNKVGIRPQLINIKTKKLITDFLIIKRENTLHILNTISPGFTSAFAFAKYVVDSYVK